MAEPPDTPVTIPSVEPTVAIVVLPLVQVPLPVALDRVVVAPTFTTVVPVIADGRALMVILVVAVAIPHALVIVYVMFATPAATAETIPLLLPTLATPVLLLVHIPPDTVLLKEVEAPAHIAVVPESVPAVADVVTETSRVE
jgi:hypothetical protein